MKIRSLLAVVALTALLAGLARFSLPGSTMSPPAGPPLPAPLGPGREAAAKGQQQAAESPLPRVEAGACEFKFGTMDVGVEGEHTFVIRNAGTAPLALKQGESSCGCLRGELLDRQAAPGGTARVRVRWRPLQSAELFRQGVLIVTNDPQRQDLRLWVSGRVLAKVAASTDAVVFTRVRPGTPALSRLTVYSQRWQSLAISRVECSDPRVTCRVAETSSDSLRLLGASSAQDLEVSLETADLTASMEATLKIDVEGPAGETPPAPLELPVVASVAGRVALFSRYLDGDHFLRLGTITQGEGLEAIVHVYLRGERQPLEVQEIKAEPDFLKIRLTHDESGTVKGDHYLLHIEVPRDTPPVDWMGTRRARVHLRTSHPALPLLELDVSFAVVPRAR